MTKTEHSGNRTRLLAGQYTFTEAVTMAIVSWNKAYVEQGKIEMAIMAEEAPSSRPSGNRTIRQ